MLEDAHGGVSLSVHVHKYAGYGGFGIVKGEVLGESKLLSEEEIKTWHKSEEE